MDGMFLGRYFDGWMTRVSPWCCFCPNDTTLVFYWLFGGLRSRWGEVPESEQSDPLCTDTLAG